MRLDDVEDGEVHGAEVPGGVRALDDHAPLGVEDGHREVLTLARLGGVRGPVDGRPDLDGDRVERSPHDTERDGIRLGHELLRGTRSVTGGLLRGTGPGAARYIGGLSVANETTCRGLRRRLRSATVRAPRPCAPGARRGSPRRARPGGVRART